MAEFGFTRDATVARERKCLLYKKRTFVNGYELTTQFVSGRGRGREDWKARVWLMPSMASGYATMEYGPDEQWIMVNGELYDGVDVPAIFKKVLRFL